MKLIKAVLFDMDGILFDSERYFQNRDYEILLKLGFQGKKDDLRKAGGLSLGEIYLVYEELMNHRVSAEEIAAAAAESYAACPADYRRMLFADVPASLAWFQKNGIRMACCSSSSEQVIHEALKQADIGRYFTFIQSSENTMCPKPSPEVYLRAMNALSMSAGECIVYEDSAVGVRAGKNAGIFTVARRDPLFPEAAGLADLAVDNITQLKEWVIKENSHAGSN